MNWSTFELGTPVSADNAEVHVRKTTFQLAGNAYG